MYLLGVERVVLVSLRVFKPQKIQSWSFCSTFKGVEPKNMTGDNVLCKKCYLLGFLSTSRRLFSKFPRSTPVFSYGSHPPGM